MTNTALLIIATMIVAILVQTVVNIALSNSNMKLNESLDKIEFKLKTEKSKNLNLQDELRDTRCWITHHKDRADEAERNYLEQVKLNKKMTDAITKLGFYKIVLKEVDNGE